MTKKSTKRLLNAQTAEDDLWHAKNALCRLQEQETDESIKKHIGEQIRKTDEFRQWMEERYGTK